MTPRGRMDLGRHRRKLSLKERHTDATPGVGGSIQMYGILQEDAAGPSPPPEVDGQGCDAGRHAQGRAHLLAAGPPPRGEEAGPWSQRGLGDLQECLCILHEPQVGIDEEGLHGCPGRRIPQQESVCRPEVAGRDGRGLDLGEARPSGSQASKGGCRRNFALSANPRTCFMACGSDLAEQMPSIGRCTCSTCKTHAHPTPQGRLLHSHTQGVPALQDVPVDLHVKGGRGLGSDGSPRTASRRGLWGQGLQ